MTTKTKSAKTKDDPCWEGYKKLGTKIKGGKKVPDCVPVEKKKKQQVKKYHCCKIQASIRLANNSHI